MGEVVVVTAGSRGIGAAICALAGASGYAVAVNYNRSEAEAHRVVDAIRACGGRAEAIQADVTREADVERLFAAVDRTLGRPTALVNNAGGGKLAAHPDGLKIAEAGGGDIDALMALNVTSAILCSREAIRRMARHAGGAGGAIVNVSSDCGRRGGPVARRGGAEGLVIYGAAKAAVDGFTLGLAAEVAEDGIRVNSVRPATILTEQKKEVGPDELERMSAMIPLGHPGRPEDVAEVVMFLLSEKAAFMTGAFVDVTGGR